MTSSPLEDAIFEIWAGKYSPSDLNEILNFLDEDLDVLSPSSANPKSLAPYVHGIYAQGTPSVHGCLLKLICTLELVSPQSIIEECDFDILITRSLEAPPPDPGAKIDEERSGAFKAVILLLKRRHYLPESIIRSLVAMYAQPKPIYRPCILSFLCQAAVHCPDQLKRVPESWQLLIDNLAETGSPALAQLVLYSVEHNASFVYQEGLI
jgi:hypothetical protein